MGTISFSINNGRKLKLWQREPDGNTLIIIEDKSGNIEPLDAKEGIISAGDFVMLINHFRSCKQNDDCIN